MNAASATELYIDQFARRRAGGDVPAGWRTLRDDEIVKEGDLSWHGIKMRFLLPTILNIKASFYIRVIRGNPNK